MLGILTRATRRARLRPWEQNSWLCASAAHTCPWHVLGLARGAARGDIKKAYYVLAKQTHPDVVGDGAPSAAAAFLEIHAAFEILMREDDDRARGSELRNGVRVRTAPSSAARGGESGGRKRRPGAKVVHDRERALGEVLSDRLAEEADGPALATAIHEVWDDIVYEQLRVTEAALEALFRACGRNGGGGLPGALRILRDANERGLLTKASREAAVVSIIKWCKEDNTSFSKILGELGDADRQDPETRELYGYANALYSGLSEGYSGGGS